jgi:2-methylisocitrate lyase-like PEP mutase family enzyme
LIDAAVQAERLTELTSEARSAGVNLVLNARVDVFRHSDVSARSIEEARRRAHLYGEAGADCIFPIRLGNEEAIKELVAALSVPVNVLLRPDTPAVDRLIELGVRRISLGGGLFRTAYRAAQHALEDLRGGEQR